MEAFNVDSAEDMARLLQLHRYAQVGRCVNGVTHDVNNLLGAAMAYAELASLDENISPETAKMLSQIVDGVTKCSALVKSLTSIARRERPDVNLAPLDRVLDEMLLLRDYEMKMEQITVEKAYDSPFPSLPVDLPKLKLAIVFLLMNAQEALRGKQTRVMRLRARRVTDGAFLEIWDSGDGLAPDRVEQAFEPMTSFWPGHEHLGMGLYVARKIAEMHGGSLTYAPDTGFRMDFKFENQFTTAL